MKNRVVRSHRSLTGSEILGSDLLSTSTCCFPGQRRGLARLACGLITQAEMIAAKSTAEAIVKQTVAKSDMMLACCHSEADCDVLSRLLHSAATCWESTELGRMGVVGDGACVRWLCLQQLFTWKAAHTARLHWYPAVACVWRQRWSTYADHSIECDSSSSHVLTGIRYTYL